MTERSNVPSRLSNQTPTQPTPAIRLLQTKLYVPRTYSDTVPRPWLLERLNAGLQRRLTLVCAPAGSGKSTLLSAWAAQSHAHVAWLALDERDNDPVHFWAYVVAALQTVDASLGRTAMLMVQSPQMPRVEITLTELLNDATHLDGDTVLVLDDYHVIESTSIHEGMAFLLDNLAPRLHVFVASRSEPPPALPLPLLRARGQLVEVHDLRFTDQEAGAFFRQVMGLSLAAEDVAALEQLTEGWAAGLQLAALALQPDLSNLSALEPDDGRVSALVRSFTGQHRFIFDYLAQEVFERQPEDVQRFLLQTAPLERLCGELCDAVTTQPGGQRMLEYLESAHLFIVPLDQQHRWYRYHHLFSEFLRHRLHRTVELVNGEAAALHGRASRWYEAHGLLNEALLHALKEGDSDRTDSLLLSAGSQLFARSDLPTLVHWLDVLPLHRIRNPKVNMMFAWALLATSHMSQVKVQLMEVERALGVRAESTPPPSSLSGMTRGALAEILCIRANLAFHSMDSAQARRLSEQALAYLSSADVPRGLFDTRMTLLGVAHFNIGIVHEFSGDTLSAGEHLRKVIALHSDDKNQHLFPIAASHLAQVEMQQAHLRQAAILYQDAIVEVVREGLPQSPMAAIAYAGLGSILREWNQLERAAVHLQRAIELGRQWDNMEALQAAHLSLARVREDQGDVEGAWALLCQARELAHHAQTRWGVSLVMARQAEFQARYGASVGATTLDADDPLTIKSWPIDLDSTQPIPYSLEVEAILYIRVLIAKGAFSQALRLASRILSQAEAGGRHGHVIEVLALQALAWQAEGDVNAALAALSRALSLAEPEGYMRVFVDAGMPIADLLRQLGSTDVRVAAYAARLLNTFEGDAEMQAHKHKPEPAPTPARTATPNTLSEREREVLRLIAAGHTNQEIAAKLVISLNTVKTHVKNILNQLDARNRTEAARRARELNLL